MILLGLPAKSLTRIWQNPHAPAGSATRDAGIIIASQMVEHYEIAAYGGLAQLARTLGLTEVVGILEQTLAEEKESDRLLTEIAESGINDEAGEEA